MYFLLYIRDKCYGPSIFKVDNVSFSLKIFGRYCALLSYILGGLDDPLPPPVPHPKIASKQSRGRYLPLRPLHK